MILTGKYWILKIVTKENCSIMLANGIQIWKPLENDEISFDIKTFRKKIKKIIAEQKVDDLFNNLKQYIVTGKYDLIKEKI